MSVTISRRLKIVPNGIVRGGMVAYRIDPTGVVSYDGVCEVKVGFFTKRKEFSGDQRVDPAMLQQTSYDEVGEVQIMPDFGLKVLSVVPCKVAIDWHNKDIHGVLTLVTAEGGTVVVDEADIKAAVSGMVIKIRAVVDGPGGQYPEIGSPQSR